MATWPLLFLLVVGTVVGVDGGILEYKDMKLSAGRGRYERVSMVSLQDTLIGNTQPYSDFNMTFRMTEGEGGHFEMAYMQARYLNKLGYKGFYCCTPVLASSGRCSPVNHLVISDDAASLPKDAFNYQSIPLNGVTPINWHAHNNIQRSGLYYVFFINCDTTTVIMDGVTEWMNPYGYLEAAEFGFVPFFIGLAIAYVILLALWLIPTIKYRDRLVIFQNFITGLIILGFLAALLSLSELLQYNHDGHLTLSLVIAAATLDTLKRVLGRILLIIVCMGYRVITDRIHIATIVGLAVYGILYYIVGAADQIIDDLQDRTLYPIHPQVAFFALLPVVALDAVFYAWVFTGLMFTLRKLKDQKQEQKLFMYRYLLIILVAGLVLSLLFIVLQELTIGLRADALWSFWWLFDSWWQLFSFIILCAIAFIWRPQEDNDRYMYRELRSEPREDGEEGESEDEMEMDQFTGGAPDDEDASRAVGDYAKEEPSRAHPGSYEDSSSPDTDQAAKPSQFV